MAGYGGIDAGVELDQRTAYPKAAAEPGAVILALKELGQVLDDLDGAAGDLMGKIHPVLDQRERPEEVPNIAPDTRSSCEVGQNIEEAVRRLRRLRAHLTELARRVEL